LQILSELGLDLCPLIRLIKSVVAGTAERDYILLDTQPALAPGYVMGLRESLCAAAEDATGPAVEAVTLGHRLFDMTGNL